MLKQSRASLKQSTGFWMKALSLLSKACCNCSEILAKICSHKLCQKKKSEKRNVLCSFSSVVFSRYQTKWRAEMSHRSTSGGQGNLLLLIPSSSHLSPAWRFNRHTAMFYSSLQRRVSTQLCLVHLQGKLSFTE